MGIKDILCFGLIGALPLIFVHKLVRMTLDFLAFPNWRPVEVTLEDLEVTAVGGKGPFVAGNRNVKVRFSYHYGNAEFQGNSVAIPDLAPFPVMQYSPSTYLPLQEIFAGSKRMQGWVDPDRPERAVLRDVSARPYVLGAAAMTAVFFGLGYYTKDLVPQKVDLEVIAVLAVVVYLLLAYWSYRLKRQSLGPRSTDP